MSINLSGVLLPLTTPFTPDEAFDAPGLIANIKSLSQTGVTGFVLLGSTGERVNLDEQEYLQVIESARRTTPETLTFIAGAGQQSTRGTVKEIEQAASAGAQAVLVITPNYYRSAITQDALIDHYIAVADKSPVPVILYSMPDLTGIVIEPDTAAQLSEHENIIGIKDSSNDVARFAKTVSIVRKDFAVMIGNGTVFADALRAGARGGILAVGCAVPELCLEIYHAVQAGDDDRATELQNRLTPLARAVTKTYGIGGLKAAMEMSGFIGGPVRAPLKRPSEEACADIGTLLQQATRVPGKAQARTGAQASSLL
jgi:4-hydroxy-2-oxoglutarate aldolase